MVSKFITYNRSGEHLNVQGLALHDTATAGATAEDEYNYFNSGNRDASAHAFVDWNGAIQTVPFDEVAWHAGQIANHRYIGIEMCKPATHNVEQFNAVWNNTVSLFADLIKQYKLSVNDITTHNEISQKWHETNHTDPTGYLKEYGKTIDDFRRDVQKKLNGDELTMAQYDELVAKNKEQDEKLKELTPYIYNYIDDNMPKWARPYVRKAVDIGLVKGNEKNELNLTDDKIFSLVLILRSQGIMK